MSALLGVPRLLDGLRGHYGGVPSADAARPPAAGGALLPAELRALRQGLLNVALSLLASQAVPAHKAPRIPAEHVQVGGRGLCCFSLGLALRIATWYRETSSSCWWMPEG